MVSRTIVRTPRKQKVWAGYNAVTVLGAGASAGVVDLLSPWRTDFGVSKTAKLTVMRIFGTITLRENGDSTSSEYIIADVGIAWLHDNVTSSDFPAFDHGVRTAQWIAQGTIEGQENTSSLQYRPAGANNVDNALPQWEVNSTMMRTQPTPDDELKATYNVFSGTTEANTLAIHWKLQMLLALP